MPNVLAWPFLQPCSSLSFDAISCLKVASILHILHQSSPLLHQLLRSQGLIWIIICYDFACCIVSLFLLLRETEIFSCCGYGIWHPLTDLAILALSRQWSSINNASWYHHCNNYSSSSELQCKLMIITSLPQPLSSVVPCVYLTHQLFLCHRPTSSITQWEITGLVCYLQCPVVFGTFGIGSLFIIELIPLM